MEEQIFESLLFWGLLVLFIGVISIAFYSQGVNNGVERTMKEAYNLGFMTKEIVNDKIIYKWSEGKF